MVFVPKKEMRTCSPHFLFGKATNTSTMNHSLQLTQAQITLLFEHISEISDPRPGFVEILSILEPLVNVSNENFIGLTF
jgi:hypothetical protein